MGIEYDAVPLGSLPGVSRIFRGLVEREPALRERFPLRFWERDDLARALAPRPVAATPELWDAVARESERLGASAAGLDLLREIRDGRGAFVVTGQQPGLFGGPLYTLFKIATAVDVAEWIRREFSLPCAPLLWNAGDDVDFDEIASAVLAGNDFRPVRIALDPSSRRAGHWVGDIGRADLDRVLTRLDGEIDGGPGSGWIRDRVREARERCTDLGEFFSALYLGIFGDRGLIVLDARRPEVRLSAGNLFSAYVQRADRIHRLVGEAGDRLARMGYERRLSDAASRFALFAVEDGRRLEIAREDRERETLSRLRERPETIAPNAVLRPLVEDSVLPVAAVVLGPGEAAYWAQLREAYRELGVEMPAVWPRLSATLVPEVFEEWLGGGRPGELVGDLHEILRARRGDALPEDLRRILEDLRSTLSAKLADLRGPLKSLDPDLLGVVESAERKIDFQLRRIGEQAAGKMGARSPLGVRLRRIRNFLFPQGRLQERSLSSLWPFYYSGRRVAEDLLSLAARHRERLLSGAGAHLAVRLSRGH